MGASFADWFDKPQHMSGLGFGTAPVAMILTLAVSLAIAYIWIRFQQRPAPVAVQSND
jgi:uncharacterized membrane-anchored protein